MEDKDTIELDVDYDIKFKIGLLIIFFSPILGYFFYALTSNFVQGDIVDGTTNTIYLSFCMGSMLVGGIALFISGLLEKLKA